MTYNQIQFSATLNNVYRGLYRAFTAAEISELGLTSDEKIEEYAVENYLDSFDYFPSGMSNYTINKSNLSDGETVTFVAITFDEDGSYAISKTTATTKKVNYAADGAITVKAVSVDRTNAASPVVTFEVTGATKVIIGGTIRTGRDKDESVLNTTAINVLSTFPAIYAQYSRTTANVVEGKAEITLSSATYYDYWAVTAVTGTTAEDVQLLKPFFLSQEELQALPDTVKEEASEEESAQ